MKNAETASRLEVFKSLPADTAPPRGLLTGSEQMNTSAYCTKPSQIEMAGNAFWNVALLRDLCDTLAWKRRKSLFQYSILRLHTENSEKERPVRLGFSAGKRVHTTPLNAGELP